MDHRQGQSRNFERVHPRRHQVVNVIGESRADESGEHEEEERQAVEVTRIHLDTFTAPLDIPAYGGHGRQESSGPARPIPPSPVGARYNRESNSEFGDEGQETDGTTTNAGRAPDFRRRAYFLGNFRQGVLATAGNRHHGFPCRESRDLRLRGNARAPIPSGDTGARVRGRQSHGSAYLPSGGQSRWFPASTFGGSPAFDWTKSSVN